ncbi:MAG: YceI family protein [Acidimicrobiales bacterium]
MSKNRMLIVGCGAMVAVVVAAWFVVFGGDAPDAVDVATANAQLDEVLGATDVIGAAPFDGEVGAAPFDGEVDGVWIIDDEIGEFDFETASGSFAGFRVDEELTVGSVVAVGRSGGVTGSLTIEAGQLVETEVVVDMNAIVSNDSRREGAIRRAVGASTNPTASFVLDDPVDLPDGLANGEVIRVEISGQLTVNGVTNPTKLVIDAVVRDDGYGVITGSTDIVFDEFGVTPPSAPIVVSVDDTGIIEFQLVVARG